MRPSVISLCAIAGSAIGGYVPSLLGDGSLFLSLIAGVVGAVAGVWFGFRLTD